jgi:putative membrane protein
MAMTLVLADDWGNGNHSWFLVVPLLWILLFFVCARFWFWRRGPWGPRVAAGRSRATPQEILAERYARGEISLEEYRERLGNLQP